MSIAGLHQDENIRRTRGDVEKAVTGDCRLSQRWQQQGCLRNLAIYYNLNFQPIILQGVGSMMNLESAYGYFFAVNKSRCAGRLPLRL